MIEVNIVGTGNVAWHLAKALGAQNNAVVMQVAGRSQASLDPFKHMARHTVTINNLTAADVTIIAVSDDMIAQVSEQIPFDNTLVVHTSGYTAMSTLSRKHKKGVFYPLQSFSKDDVSLHFAEIPILVEAENDEDEKTLRELASMISDTVQVINSVQRRQLHLAAVFANNFTNHCYTVAQDICEQYELDVKTLHPLILKTAQKALENGPTNSQTGPAKRGDKEVINKQLDLLENPDHKDIYNTLTKAIYTTYGKKL